MTTSYGHDQDAEPPTPENDEPAIADDPSAEPSEQDADTPDARKTQEPPD
jgi:hypothetical protein